MKDCNSRLPSYQSAIDFIEDPNLETTLRVIGSWVGRSLIVAAGMGLAGKSFNESILNGLIAASAIEVFVLGHAIHHVSNTKKEAANAQVQLKNE